jgi:uncharacterized protein DUF6247
MVAAMSTAAVPDDSGLPPLPLMGASPNEVRASLHPEYRADFDRAYLAALEEAGRTLELSGIHSVVEHWRQRSWVTRDRDRHRRVVRRAFELLTGSQPPDDEPVEVTEARF